MKVGALLGGLLAGALASGCATAPPTPDAQAVDELRFEGVDVVPEGELKQRIVTTESSWLPAWVPVLGHAEWFDATAWQADLRRITRVYEAHGYYQARILEEQVDEGRPGHVKLLVKLREGTPARLTELTLVGLEALPAEHRELALAGFPLKEGAIFLEDDWGKAKAQLSARLRQLGYAEVMVTGQATVDADAAAVTASLEVKPGRRYTFGRVLVATDPGAKVPPKLIVEQAAADLKPGTFFSESALAEAQARVFQMGVFAAVKVNRGAPDVEEGTVPVVIAVREAPFRSVRMGVGAGGDMIRQDVHLVFEHTNRNFGLSRLIDGESRLDRLSVKAKAGVAFLPTILSVALNSPASQVGPVGSVLTEWEVPRSFGRKDLSLQVAVNLARALESTYDYFGGEAKVGFVWRPRIDVSVVPSLNVDAYLLNSELSPAANAPTAAIGCPTRPLVCLVSFADVAVEWDRRDNRLEPHRGTYLALDVQGGLSSTTHLVPFVRVAPEARGYLTFWKERFTLSAKLKAGTLLAPDNETPIVARFFSGGSAMRGFNMRRLSPMSAVPVLDANHQPIVIDAPGVSGDNVRYLGQALPIGGSGLLEGAVELRWNASELVSLAAFSDTALVSWDPLTLDAATLGELYTAVGLGVRLHTPIGPLRVDLAVRLPNVGGPQQVFQPAVTTQGPIGPRDLYVPVTGGCFGPMGATGSSTYAGAPDGLCAWHLSVGEAF